MRATVHILAVALSACSPQQGTEPAPTPEATATTHPVSGLQVITLTIKSGGKVLDFQVELAASQQEQARGLMFREKLGDFEGMIFPTDPPRSRSFWMRNTPEPLDLVFVGLDNRILNIAENATPYSLDPILSDGPTSGVLELRGGRAAELGLKPGDEVNW